MKITQISAAATFPHLSDASRWPSRGEKSARLWLERWSLHHGDAAADPVAAAKDGRCSSRGQAPLQLDFRLQGAIPRHACTIQHASLEPFCGSNRSVRVLLMKAISRRSSSSKIPTEPCLSSSHLYYFEPRGLRCHGFCRYGYKQLCRWRGRRRKSGEECWEQSGP